MHQRTVLVEYLTHVLQRREETLPPSATRRLMKLVFEGGYGLTAWLIGRAEEAQIAAEVVWDGRELALNDYGIVWEDE